MVKFSAVAIAAAATIGSVAAFAPVPHVPRVTALSAATLDAPPLSPLTCWGEEMSDIRKVQQEYKQQPLPEFAPTVSAKDLGLNTVEEQLQYVKDNAFDLKMKMEEGGAVIFRDFDLMKTQDGFQDFYNALGMHVCLDPLHSVSARPTVDGQKNSPVYEAVNKESRKNFFIGTYMLDMRYNISDAQVRIRLIILSLYSLFISGMHNEFVGTRAPRAAAFVCFKAAEEGGEFLIADGRRMFRDLKSELVEELYNRQIRYSVMELPFFGWVDNLPEPLQGGAMSVIKGIVSAAINAKVDFDVDLRWGEGGYDQTKMLQARAPSQPPIVVHPVTGEPTWFCNVHSHSSKLRHDRESM